MWSLKTNHKTLQGLRSVRVIIRGLQSYRCLRFNQYHSFASAMSSNVSAGKLPQWSITTSCTKHKFTLKSIFGGRVPIDLPGIWQVVSPVIGWPINAWFALIIWTHLRQECWQPQAKAFLLVCSLNKAVFASVLTPSNLLLCLSSRLRLLQPLKQIDFNTQIKIIVLWWWERTWTCLSLFVSGC